MNLTMIAALGKMHEWELHLRGAVTNGVTVEEMCAFTTENYLGMTKAQSTLHTSQVMAMLSNGMK